MGNHWDLLLCMVLSPLEFDVTPSGNFHTNAPRGKDSFF